MKTITKSLIGTVAAGAMAMASASPAAARDNDRGGISTGDVIAGALVIGGIAAIAATAGKSQNRDGYYNVNYGNDYRDRRGYDGSYYYGGGANPRQAVEMCVRSAESTASRYSYGGRADVTDIRQVDARRDGYTVKGRIAVNTQSRYWRDGDARYGRGWDGDYRGWNNRLTGYDSGSFTCKIRYGQVVDLDFSGIRGL